MQAQTLTFEIKDTRSIRYRGGVVISPSIVQLSPTLEYKHVTQYIHVCQSEGETGACYGIISAVYAAKLHIARH